MKTGITERGDAAIDLTWANKLDNLDTATIITKNLSLKFRDTLLKAHNDGHKLILHCTCTGFGGTIIEPHVPNYKTQLDNLKTLIDAGFPAKQCVLRIDPIFPTEKGLKRVCNVLNYFTSLNTNVTRIRISILDEYRHVKTRFANHGLPNVYPGSNFYASAEQFKTVADTLSQYNYIFETCAEPQLVAIRPDKFKQIGCISKDDLNVLNIDTSSLTSSENKQNRYGCHCLSCKTELLTRRGQCPHGCLYCYWK